MVQALGYSVDVFDPADPGRLCRGRERWIEPFELEGPTPPLHRLVVSGATFSDDSAADARRGLPFSGIDLATVLVTMFPRRALVAFMEDGHPADIPEGAEGVEMYEGHRAGGRSQELMVRWFRKVSGVREIRAVLGSEEDPKVLGFAVVDGDVELDDEVRQRFFLLVGMGSLDSPPARFQPAALPDVLEFCRAVVLVHRDKHGPALGVYSKEPLGVEERVVALAEKEGHLAVSFAIPPMLARWDRALAEAREAWLARTDAEFPVPVAEAPRWQPRRGRRGGGREAMREEAERAARAAQGEE
jgi:hypothetical protein